MKMLRRRSATWAFIIWNLAMAASMWLALSPDLWLSSSCDQLPYGSDRTACAMGAGLGGAFLWMASLLAVALTWLIGSVVIGYVWLRHRSSGQDRGEPTTKHPPRPRITRSHGGSDPDAVLVAAASNVVEWRRVGLVLVEAAWMAGPTSVAGGLCRLGVAFGKPGVRFERLWPDKEDVIEAVMARVPNPTGL